jgi:lysophospholipase
MGVPAIRPDHPQPAGVAPAGGLALEHILVEGMRVRVGHREPGAAPARGTVVVLPGRAEFIEKYAETLDEVAAMGFAAAILDWRGQGGSDRFLHDRRRGHVVQVEDYLADLAAVLAWLDRRGAAQPLLMLAHSMGGHVGLRFLHDRPGAFVGAMMTAPMFGIRLQPTPEPLARAICAVAIRLGAAQRYAPGQRDRDPDRIAFARNRLTSCQRHFDDLLRQVAATPELALGGVTYGWLGAALRSIALTRRPGYLEAIDTPVLVCQAGQERIVSNRAEAYVARRLPRGRLVVFPEARHELLRERDAIRRQLFATFDDFAAEVMRCARRR